jgi:prolipoprotein diacylglyceryl transferase
MRRVLFRCGGFSFYSYPTLLYLGSVFGVYVQLYAAGLNSLDVQRTLVATLVLLSVALLGARLLYVLLNWRRYLAYPRRILQFSRGGAALYGGLLSAVPLSLPLLSALEIPIGKFWDGASLALLAGLIVTRMGCFLNGCCAGQSTASGWGINLPNHRDVWAKRVPLQLIEASWGLIALAVTSLMFTHWFSGAAVVFSVVMYGAGRFVLESFRDETDQIYGVNVHKAISAGLVVSALGLFAAESLL